MSGKGSSEYEITGPWEPKIEKIMPEEVKQVEILI